MRKNATIRHYHENAERFADQYNGVSAELVHADWLPLLNQYPVGSALDVGAGSGRDARWLAERGWAVTAVEPANQLRVLGEQYAGEGVRWLDDTLPTLPATRRLGNVYDLILLSAVWMHLKPGERPKALAVLKSLLTPNGNVVITLRFGLSDPARPMYPVSVNELQQQADEAGLILAECPIVPDKLNRSELHWQTVVLVKDESKLGGNR